MEVSVTWNVSPEVWRDVVARSPQATFFHTPGWYQAHAGRGECEPAAALFRFEDGYEALLPMATRRCFRGLLVQAQAGVECGYGGIVSPNVLAHSHLQAAYRLLGTRYRDVQVTGNPFAAWEGALYDGAVSTMTTQLVPVTDREAQLKQMSNTRAARVRKAAKVGFELTVVEGPTEDDVSRFYPLYAAHASYWRYTRWVRDEAYFRSLLRHAGRDLVLFLVTLDGELAGFRLLAVQGRTAIGLHLATTAQHEKLDVGPFMIGETLAWCHAHGVATFDFLPSGPLQGVKDYKASFGGRTTPFLAMTRESWRGAALRQAWTRMRPASEAGVAAPATSPS